MLKLKICTAAGRGDRRKKTTEWLMEPLAPQKGPSGGGPFAYFGRFVISCT